MQRGHVVIIVSWTTSSLKWNSSSAQHQLLLLMLVIAHVLSCLCTCRWASRQLLTHRAFPLSLVQFQQALAELQSVLWNVEGAHDNTCCVAGTYCG